MILEVKIDSYLKKYLVSRGQGVIHIRKNNFFGMLLLAHIKYRDKRFCFSSRNKRFSLNDTIQAEIGSVDFKERRIKSVIIGDKECYNFAQNIRDFFFQDFFNHMNLQVAKNPDMQIKQLTEAFKDKLNLSEDDISTDTLLRVYRRYRASAEYKLMKYE